LHGQLRRVGREAAAREKDSGRRLSLQVRQSEPGAVRKVTFLSIYNRLVLGQRRRSLQDHQTTLLQAHPSYIQTLGTDNFAKIAEVAGIRDFRLFPIAACTEFLSQLLRTTHIKLQKVAFFYADTAFCTFFYDSIQLTQALSSLLEFY
jgi:hypothetical protein